VHALRRVGLDQVGRHVSDALLAELAGERLQPLLAASDEDDSAAGLAGQAAGGGLADAARGSGDERDAERAGTAFRPSGDENLESIDARGDSPRGAAVSLSDR